MAPHYFDADPEARHQPQTVQLVLPDLHLWLATDRGVFSPDRIDLGTRVLLESVPPPPDRGRLLDLGCGYGPVALTMASRVPNASVLGVDVNARAVALAESNAKNHGLYNVDFLVVSGGEEPAAPRAAGPFDCLWSNPPIRIGKPALHALLGTWLDRLSPAGTAHFVVHKHLGADSLQRWLEQQGHPCQRTASRSGYRVLRVEPRPAAR